MSAEGVRLELPHTVGFDPLRVEFSEHIPSESDATPKLFSAVVLCFNASRHIENCIESLVRAFRAFDTPSEIVIFENGSTDGSAEIVGGLARRHPEIVRPLFSHGNVGTTVSRNRAISRACGRYILIFDADATIDGIALERLRDTLATDPRIAIAAPQLRYPDGRFQISTDQFPTITNKLKRLFALRAMESLASPPEADVDVDYAISACWLLSRTVFEEVGFFDEAIFYSPEDVDYCVRVWEAGYRVVYCSEALAIHDAQELSRLSKFGTFTFRHAQGLVYYFWKHRYCLSRARLERRLRLERVAGHE